MSLAEDYKSFNDKIDRMISEGKLRNPDPEKDKDLYDRSKNDNNANVKRLFRYDKETDSFELCRGIELKTGDLVLTVFKNSGLEEKGPYVNRLWQVVRDSLVYIANGEENKKASMFLDDDPISVSNLVE